MKKSPADAIRVSRALLFMNRDFDEYGFSEPLTRLKTQF